MPLFRIALSFAKYKDPELDDFASNVVIKTTANATLFTGQTANVTAVGTAQVPFIIPWPWPKTPAKRPPTTKMSNAPR